MPVGESTSSTVPSTMAARGHSLRLCRISVLDHSQPTALMDRMQTTCTVLVGP